MKKKVVIAGGSGFIGAALINHFIAQQAEVIVLTRALPLSQNNSYRRQTTQHNKAVTYVKWNGFYPGDWSRCLEAADVLINLCGKSVNCRYTEKNKAAIFSSRLTTTCALGEAIEQLEQPPAIWINASSATIYRHATDRPQDEYNGEIANDFSVQVCKQWEAAFFRFNLPHTRQVALRMAITLGQGGVMTPYLNLVRLGLGGAQAGGQQMFSWIHIEDTCNIIQWIIDHRDITGVLNLAAPHPVSNAALMATLRRASGIKFGLPAYKWMLQLGALLIGTETELLLKSRWVVPTKLLQSGYIFRYPTIREAVLHIIQQKTTAKSNSFL